MDIPISHGSHHVRSHAQSEVRHIAVTRPTKPTTVKRLTRGLIFWLLSVVLLAPAVGQQVAVRPLPTERQKIDYLIDSVAGLHDAVFIRNGTSYDASQAAAHLRLKWRFAGSRIHTADEFITCCATRSSVSGISYTIRFAHGPPVDAATWLRSRLAAYAADSASSAH